MKHILRQGSLLLSLLVAVSCTDVEKAQFAVDSVAPGTISNYKVTNKEGRSVITYDLPADEDLLYVKATYKLGNGKDMEIKASAYVNELEVLGFGKAAQHDITLTAVDRSGNESEPVVVQVAPLDNPIYKIFEEMQVSSDFGGLSLKWKNETEEEITISVTTPNEYDEMISAQNFYSKSVEGSGFVRGYSTETSETEGRRFAITITDHWGNQTDVLDRLFYPIYEVKIPSDRFAKYVVPGYGDPGRYNSKNDYKQLWNDSWGTNNDHYHSLTGREWPLQLGLNLGRLVKLSRIEIEETWGGVKDFIHIAELTFYGNLVEN